MTTTKEDQIRAEFEAWFKSAHPDDYTELGAWKACAESYQQQLAEKDVAMHHLVNAYQVAEQKLSDANARNARLVDVLQHADDNYCFTNDVKVSSALDANSEAVAAWYAEKLEPLRREVAMLHKCLELFPQHFHDAFDLESECEICTARNTTQAAAEAYEREVMIKALDNFGNRAGYGSKTLLDMISELRAANKGKEIV